MIYGIFAAVLAAHVPFAPVVPEAFGQLHQVQMSTAERASELQMLHDELNDPNPFIRRAAFEIVMAGDDDLAKRLAIDAAMGSDDTDLQSDALRAWLMRHERLSLDLELPGQPSDAQRSLYETLEPLWFTIREVSPSGLRLDRRGSSNRSHQGTFVPGGLRVDYSSCRMDLHVVERRRLAGSYSCGSEPGLVVTAHLQ
jgi:hypothetical protein